MDQKIKWQERHFGKELVKCLTVRQTDDFETVSTVEALQSVDYIGVYFSFANVHSKNDDFLHKLRDFYEHSLRSKDTRSLEIVQVVLWANNDVHTDFEHSHSDNLVSLPWFAVPFKEIELKVGME